MTGGFYGSLFFQHTVFLAAAIACLLGASQTVSFEPFDSLAVEFVVEFVVESIVDSVVAETFVVKFEEVFVEEL